MSPQQVEGKDADVRSDIFSLGAVLYEMITGTRAFEGRTTASTIAAILAAEPKPISTIQPMSPPELERVVKACLEKDPDDRMQTAHDVRLQLKWIAEAGSKVTLPVAAMRSMPWRRALIFGLGTLLPQPVEPPSTAFPPRDHWSMFPVAFRRINTGWCGSIATGAEQPVAAPARAYVFPRLSPDGRRIAVTIQGQDVQLWLYDLSRETLTRFAFDGKFNTNPVWTPDGKRIAFNSNKEGPVNLFWQLADGERHR
ncbi:MAG TPA: protein kinase [Terriglobales bacterium]